MDSPTAPAAFGATDRSYHTLLVVAVALAAIGAAATSVTYRAFELDRFFVPKELALHAGALVAVVVLLRRTGVALWTRADLALVTWLAWSVASAVFASSHWLAVRALTMSLSAGVIFWAGAELRTAGRARAVALVLGLATTIAAGSSLAQAYGASSDFFSANRVPGGFLGNRNFVAHAAAMGLPLLMWLVVSARSLSAGSLWALALLVHAAALVLSRSRAAWLSLAVWVAVLIVAVLYQRRASGGMTIPRRMRLVAAGLAAGIGIAVVVPNTLDWRSDSPYLDSVRGVVNYRGGSGAGRLRQYATSLKLVSADPLFGVGPGNWPAAYPAVTDRGDPSLSDATGMTSNPWPSSDWVAALAERGIPGALALAAFAFFVLVQAWRGWCAPDRALDERLAALAGGSVVLIGVVEGMFDAVLLLALPLAIVFGAAGALVPAGFPTLVSMRTRRGRQFVAGVCALCWVAFVVLGAARLDAMRLYSRGTSASVRAAAARDPGSYRIQMRAAELASARGDCASATRYAANARDLFPHAAAPRAILARCR